MRLFVTLRRALLLAACSLLLVMPALAQYLPYGSADDPAEYFPAPWWRAEAHLDVRAGASLIGPQWRAVTQAALGISAHPFSAHLQGTVRGGIYGLYEEDANEWYDLVRLIEFARYDPGLDAPLFARLGPIRHMRLGYGHLVDLYHSDLAWDDRTVGAEASATSQIGQVTIFTDDLRLTGLKAGRFSSRPLRFIPGAVFESAQIGAEIATNLGHGGGIQDGEQTAYSVDSRFTVLNIGGIELVPHAGFTSFLDYGYGVHSGISVEADNLLDLARFHLTFAYHRNSDGFIPGYFGTFYQVNNPRARLLNADAYFADTRMAQTAPEQTPELAGIPLSEAREGNNLETEIRILLFNQMEFRSRFRRHYGADPLSAYNLRLFLRASDQLRFDIRFARHGLTSLLSLFRPLDDQSALSLKAAYQLFPGTWLFADAAYTYEHIMEDDQGIRYYVAQRRFEPMAGLRFTF